MKANYVRPVIKILHIQAQEVILAASGQEETTTLQIFSNQTIDNDKALAKPHHYLDWDDEEDE